MAETVAKPILRGVFSKPAAQPETESEESAQPQQAGNPDPEAGAGPSAPPATVPIAVLDGKELYYVEEFKDGRMTVENISPDFLPSGLKSILERDVLVAEYAPEPDIFQSLVEPKIIALNKALNKADRHRSKGESLSAEHWYKHALTIDEDNVKGHFGLGMTYLDRGDKDKAALIFASIMGLHAAFAPEHKHMFNEFGISMRKAGLMQDALGYFGKAKALDEADDHLYFNIARSHFESGDYDQAAEFLHICLRINPDLSHAAKLLDIVKERRVASRPEGEGVPESEPDGSRDLPPKAA